MTKLYAGIDGGATKTRVVLTTADGVVLAEQVSRPQQLSDRGHGRRLWPTC